MSNQPEQVSNNQALATVLRFLKQHNLNATVDTLQKEIGLGGDSVLSSDQQQQQQQQQSLSSIARNNPEECRQSYASIVPKVSDIVMSHPSLPTTQTDLQSAKVLGDDRGPDSGYSANSSSTLLDTSGPSFTTTSHNLPPVNSPVPPSPKIPSPPRSFFPTTTAPSSQIVPTPFFYPTVSGLGPTLASIVPSSTSPKQSALVGTLPNVLTLVPGQGLARFPHQTSVMIPPPILPLSFRPLTSMVTPTSIPQTISMASTPLTPGTPNFSDISPPQSSRMSQSVSQSDYEDDSSDAVAEGVQPSISELRAFAEDFRKRRISLGYTQGAVGSSLANMGYANFAQSTISRFEQMQLSPRNAASIKEILSAWLKQAECYPQGALANTDNLPSPPLPLSNAGIIYSTRKRKRRAVFSTAAKCVLEEAFEKDPKPTRIVIEKLSSELDMLPEEVRVWFCNKRQKEKGHQSISSQEEVNSTSESPVSSTTSNDNRKRRPDSSSEIPQNFRIEEMCKSSSSSPDCCRGRYSPSQSPS